MSIPKGTKYKAVDTNFIYKHYGNANRTFREQEMIWKDAYERGVTRHCYIFLEADWTPKLFSDQE